MIVWIPNLLELNQEIFNVNEGITLIISLIHLRKLSAKGVVPINLEVVKQMKLLCKFFLTL